MSYEKHVFIDGEVLYAYQLNEMDAQIKANEDSIAQIEIVTNSEIDGLFGDTN